MPTICRFAPSPTGFLHVGNIRAAIVNFLYSKKTANSKFILRLDDTDKQRCKNQYRDMIIHDMKWLGLNYQEPLIKQSNRLDLYKKAKEQLIQNKHLYECYESQEELYLQRKTQIVAGERPIYNRASLNLTNEQKANYHKQGLKPYYRFKLEDKEISWEDKIKGKITFGGRHFSDPVVIRTNNSPTYTFCSVIDDIELKISDIIRGEDHITNTAIQIQIFEALKGKIPSFSHLALIKANDGKISKRVGGFDIKSLREEGFEPLAIINLLAQTGTAHNINVYSDITQLADNFDLSKFSKSAINYDLDELININQKLLHITSLKQAKLRLKKISEEKIDEETKEISEKIDQTFWHNVRPNLNFLFEIKEWWKICKKPLHYPSKETNKEFLKLAKELLPKDTGKEDSWQIWLTTIKEKSDRKGKELFMPLRLALTGKEHGPELKNILPLIDRKEIINRLS